MKNRVRFHSMWLALIFVVCSQTNARAFFFKDKRDDHAGLEIHVTQDEDRKPRAENFTPQTQDESKPLVAAVQSRGGGRAPAQRLVLQNYPPIIYPYEARVQGQQGRVLLRLTLDRSGQVKSVKLIKSSGYPILDQAALQGVQHWKVDALENGSNQLFLPVTFKLNLIEKS